MKVSIINPQQYLQATWEGGSTTQLYIFPSSAVYKERDFLFRISTASIIAHDSVFTSLPGFERRLMLLEGAVLLTHEEHHINLLLPFEVDTFNGGWHTESKGVGVDYNIITSKGIRSALHAIKLEPNQNFISEITAANFLHLFVFSGMTSITINKQEHHLNKGMSMMIENYTESIKMHSEDGCIVILSEIWVDQMS